LNPENGICLSALYVKAYDKGYIGITEKFEILLSPLLKKKQKEDYYQKYFAPLQSAKIMMPQKYYPKKEFLRFHLEEVFKK
jgi:putative restriction endonuclease